jgi:hypothetical protein
MERMVDMGRMVDMPATTETHTGDDAHSAADPGSATHLGTTADNSTAPEGSRESCCDDRTAADMPCRPTDVDTVPLLCGCSRDVEVRTPADRTRNITDASWALHVVGGALPRPYEVACAAPTRSSAYSSVPDRTILFGCFLI